MFRGVGRLYGRSYIDTKKWFIKYCKEQEASNTYYINTKYHRPKPTAHREDVLTITAVAEDPICFNLENIKRYSLKECAYLLLHEIGHHYYKPKGEMLNERLADKFAIRWVIKLIKEDLV